MATPESEVDVLIIGAGPAGIMCANGLARAGVNVRIIDQRPVKISAGQADSVQPRTIEVLQSYGLAERLLREGNQLHMASFYNPSPNGGIERTGKALDVIAPSARYPFEVTRHQGAIENIFLDSMAAMDVQVERPLKPSSIDMSLDPAELKNPASYPVRVALKHFAGAEDQEIIYAKFVIGADGAHSWVRKQFGIEMEGEQSDYVWGVIDSVPETDFPDIRNRCAIHSSNGSCLVIPREGDKVRLYIQLSDQQVINPVTSRVDRNKMGPTQLFEVAQKTFQPYKITLPHEIEWWTIYIIGQRVASKFSVRERVFIVGDACHTHSPKAGQGMNAGMNDSHNLIWKLTHVLRGWAGISLLKTYEFERRKYAQELIDFDRKFSTLFSEKAQSEEFPNGVTHDQFIEAFQAYNAFASGVGIHYAPSTITNPTYQSVASKLIVGQRILPQTLVRVADGRPFEIQDLCPADTKFKIFIFLGDFSSPVSKQAERVKHLAHEMEKAEGFLTKFGRRRSVFDVMSICVGKKDKVAYLDVPAILRPHWTKVFVDDLSATFQQGGKAYSNYGIDPLEGAIVVVRPDGYVGVVAPFENISAVDAYFSAFFKSYMPSLPVIANHPVINIVAL